MDRDINELSCRQFDILVIGGGIYGAITAWDAALRGLFVALIERGDFGSATSQNSLKVIHGGLRYLQDGNLRRIRTMARERTVWMKIAPHLVHPLACLTPTYTKLSRSQLTMKVALGLNDLFSFDRNQLPDAEKNLPPGQLLTQEDCAQLLPGLDTTGMTGAALWHDAQMHSSERLLLSFVISASRAGAVVANYVEAISLLQKGSSVVGVQAKDVLSGQEFDIRAKVIINCTGAWIDQMTEGLAQPAPRRRFAASVGINLITQQIWESYAAGLPSQPGGINTHNHSPQRQNMFFIVPWRDHSIIGTWHLPWAHIPDSFMVTNSVIQEFIKEVNTAHPGLMLSIKDIRHVHYGFLPMLGAGSRGGQVRLVREGVVIDHQTEDGVSGLISLVGVKFTTARAVSQRGVDLALRKLGLKGPPCQTHAVPVAGGKIEQFQDFLAAALAKAPGGLEPDIIEHLVYTYGSDHDRILEYLQELPDLGKRVVEGSPVIKAEIVHAVRDEMAQTLVDVVQRRTELGAAGLPALPALQTCADLVGQELNWNTQQKASAIEDVRHAYTIMPEMA